MHLNVNHRLLGGLLLAAFAFVGCDRYGAEYPTGVEDRHLVIHGVLVVGAEEQEILVEHTRLIREGFYRGLTPASGSKVTLTTGDGEVYAFSEDAVKAGVYHARLAPRMGERYRLRIEGADGQVATAETVVPGTPRLVVPTADTIVKLGAEFDLHWTHAPADGYTVARGAPTGGVPSLLMELTAIPVFQDTTVRTTIGFNEGVGRTFRIAAVDSNFIRYAGDPRENQPSNPIRTTLEGAFGFFGSVAFSNPRRVTVAR